MERRIVDTNPHIKSEDQQIQMVVENIISSFKIEGIELSYEEALELVKEAYNEVKKRA